MQEQLELFGRQVGNGDDVLSVKRVGHSASFLQFGKNPAEAGFYETTTNAPRRAVRAKRAGRALRRMGRLKSV